MFTRHLYYLRVPHLYGDPGASWAIDPQRLESAAEWRAFLRKENVGWIVKASAYPEPIAQPLEKLETSSVLVPVAEKQVSDFEGMRILGVRKEIRVQILKVRE